MVVFLKYIIENHIFSPIYWMPLCFQEIVYSIVFSKLFFNCLPISCQLTYAFTNLFGFIQSSLFLCLHLLTYAFTNLLLVTVYAELFDVSVQLNLPSTSELRYFTKFSASLVMLAPISISLGVFVAS